MYFHSRVSNTRLIYVIHNAEPHDVTIKFSMHVLLMWFQIGLLKRRKQTIFNTCYMVQLTASLQPMLFLKCVVRGTSQNSRAT